MSWCKQVERLIRYAFWDLTQLLERVCRQHWRYKHFEKGTIILFCLLELGTILYVGTILNIIFFYALEDRIGVMK